MPVKERVKVDQEFKPFNSEKQEVVVLGQKFIVPTKNVIFVLESGVFPPLSVHFLELDLDPNDAPIEEYFTPFDPNNGYIVDKRDLNPTERSKKVRELIISRKGNIDTQRFPYFLSAVSDNEELEEAGISVEDFQYPQRIHLQLSFPTGVSFESPARASLGRISFDDYYPLDTGPLAPVRITDPYLTVLNEGLNIATPGDFDSVNKIRGRFRIVDLGNLDGLRTPGIQGL